VNDTKLMAASQTGVRRARVLAVDDHPQFLAVLRELIGAAHELETVAEASSGECAIKVATELEPDLVLMDIRMPGLSGIEAARQIKADHPSMLVILISTTHPDELALTADLTDADADLERRCRTTRTRSTVATPPPRHRPRRELTTAPRNRRRADPKAQIRIP
jgi:DNA-binding NarL/FixJ family response regulator